MDANLIYIKTPSGEEAVRQRTRVVQRNTRMVLILVDGKSSVGELCEKTGNPQLVEAALLELERDGMIQPQLERDSLWDQSRKVAEEIKEAALKRLAKEEEAASQPLPTDLKPLPPPTIAEPFSVGPLSISPQSSYPPAPSSLAPFSTFGGEPADVAAPPPVTPPPTADSGKGGVFSGLMRRDDSADDSIKPIRRGRALPYISLPLAAALGTLGLLLLLVLVFVFYPYGRHRPQIEAGLTQILGQPVRIADIHASFTPMPVIVLESVSVGDKDTTRAARIRLVPEVLSMLGSRVAFSSVEIDSGVIADDTMARLVTSVEAAFRTDAPATVRSLSFNRLRLSLLGLSLGGLHGQISATTLESDRGVLFVNDDRSFRLVFKIGTPSLTADFEGFAWQAVEDSPYRFDSVSGQLVWDGRSLSIRQFDARIFDGAVEGQLLLERGSQPVLSGDIRIRHMTLARLASTMGYPNQFEGELAGSLKFSGSAAEWGRVVPQLAGEGDFALQRGVLGGFDLVEAVRRAGKGSVSGGSTRFEQMTGKLGVSPGSIRLSNIALASGALRSGGDLEIAADGRLAGRLNVEMRGTASALRASLATSGSLKSPVLQAGR